MKLVLLITTLAIVKAQKFQQDFSFQPQFQTPNSNIRMSDSSLYLPPETHTSLPYIPMKNVNNLPFPYLPPTGTKAPITYPSPFPMLMSSTLASNFDEDDDDDDKDEKLKNRMSQMKQAFFQNRFNRTEKGQPMPQINEKRELRAIPKTVNYQQPVDRIDVKFPSQFQSPGPIIPINQTSASRRMIISPETQKHINIDQVKEPSYLNHHYIQLPNGFISSSTEPAIPILRLSNEMDLDGSFSYEALGADQTHYVQHSRMENMGTDKEEQVVEGSYSYVGDNGQTYTVHYIADSNGFRASGDHLPVAPPVPEIIQRSIQYNLAEEAKKPPHLKSWQEDDKEQIISESEKKNRFAIPPPPSRNLFTGRTPEAFSYSFSQVPNQQNNLVAAASSQVQTTVDFNADQTIHKANSGPISPQITFLASQGAHVPSMNSAQQSIARTFTTEKSNLPQLMNYEASFKEAEHDNNKGLWRWQYGLNANNAIQSSEKNTISRSFGEGDDVMINFNDMTPEQYTKMIQSQLEPNSGSTEAIYSPQNYQNNDNQPLPNTYIDNNNQHQIFAYATQTSTINPVTNTAATSIESTSYPYSENWYQYKHEKSTENYQKTEEDTTFDNRKLAQAYKPKILRQENFIPHSQTVTQHYDYEDDSYDIKKIKSLDTTIKTTPSVNFINNSEESNKQITNEINMAQTQQKQSTTTVSSLRFRDFIDPERKHEFHSVKATEEQQEKPFEKPESSVEEMIQDNIFLKNLFRSEKSEPKLNDISIEKKEETKPKFTADPKADKVPKYIQYQPKHQNEIMDFQKKPIDITDVLNYVSMKNYFDSNKIKPKHNKPTNYKQKNEMRYIPFQQDYEQEQNNLELSENNLKTMNRPQSNNLRGVIKNYKILQRNNNPTNFEIDHDPFKRDFISPSGKILQSPNLPPLGRAGPLMKSYLPPIYV